MQVGVAPSVRTGGSRHTGQAAPPPRNIQFDLLIIDEWLLRPLSEAESYDLLEIIEVCSQKGAMIFCTQYDTDEWYYRIDCDRPEGDDSAVAEAILDRIIHNKYAITVKGRISMRKRHAFAGSEEREVSING